MRKREGRTDDESIADAINFDLHRARSLARSEDGWGEVALEIGKIQEKVRRRMHPDDRETTEEPAA